MVFLERHHDRARAYIERARSALAERHRETEELLHTGVSAYNAGEIDKARELLTRAGEQGSDTAHIFLDRLNRVGTAPAARICGSIRCRRAAAPRDRAWRCRRGATGWTAAALFALLVAVAMLLGGLPIGSWLSELQVAAPAPATQAASDEPLPVVRASETALARARNLYADGHLRDALRALDRVDRPTRCARTPTAFVPIFSAISWPRRESRPRRRRARCAAVKCPKCSYLGFETGDRCKNCGYDFSLMSEPEIPSIPISISTWPCVHPTTRFRRRCSGTTSSSTWTPTPRGPAALAESPAHADIADPVLNPCPSRGARRATRFDRKLPLFAAASLFDDSDEPLIKLPAAPRPRWPFAVRRRHRGFARCRAPCRAIAADRSVAGA